MTRLSLAKDKISVLLLEGIHDSAVKELRQKGYTNIETLPQALDEEALCHKIADIHILGIRSRTHLTDSVFAAAKKLFSVGCFCIGTSQVNTQSARKSGIPVFNAPYSNTRSVAELVLAEIIMLLRGIHEKSMSLHGGVWTKSAADSYEIRGKTLGIVGYGHIGSQLSILAEAMGMRVLFFDIEAKLAIGNAQSCESLTELLAKSDVVSLHVPETPQTHGMIGYEQLSLCKKGAAFINASRGTVVDIYALAEFLKKKHLIGAAIDVFPVEPSSNKEEFQNPLRGLSNVILTPHIAGSTSEAQANIGNEVARKLIEYSDNGSTLGAVNFAQVALPVKYGGTRILHIHRNLPGVLKQVNEVFSSRNLNIAAQYLQTDPEIGYVVVDIDGKIEEKKVIEELRQINGTIRVRFLF
ncbi:MAG: phosphoglycerate dehydrogenase [Candidatus Riflebacteria bacterium]|nr:phosphoglycerate dehydrogenase [Candidatus Riflebacteria bacterium]